MEIPRLQKRVAKAVILHPPSHRALILRLNETERRKRSTPEQEFDEWHICGGSFESETDADLRDTAVREAREELQLVIKVLGKLGADNWDAFYEGQPAHFEAEFFLCLLQEDAPEPSTPQLNPEEISDAAWITETELLGYVARGLTTQAQKFIPEAWTRLPEFLGGQDG